MIGKTTYYQLVKFYKSILVFVGSIIVLFSSCRYSKHLPAEQKLLWQNRVILTQPVKTNNNNDFLNQLNAGILQKPNMTLFGLDIETANIGYRMPRPKLGFYNLFGKGIKKGRYGFLLKNKLVQEPTILNYKQIDTSKIILSNICFNNGFFFSKIKDSIVTKPNKKACVYYIIEPGKNFLINTIKYTVKDSNIYNLIKRNENNAFIKPNAPLADTRLSLERDRIAELLLANGYFNIRANAISIWRDTTDKNYLNYFDNPFELIALQLDSSRTNKLPTADIEIEISDSINNEKIRQFRINEIYFEIQENFGSNKNALFERLQYQNINYINTTRYINKKVIAENIFIKNNEIFNPNKIDATLQRLKTISAFNTIRADYKTIDSNTIDVYFYATMQQQISLQNNNEISQGTGRGYDLGLDIKGNLANNNVRKSGSKFTIGANVGLQSNINRQSSKSVLQLWQLNYGVNAEYRIPRLLLPDLLKWNSAGLKPVTSISGGYNVYNRPIAFLQTTANAQFNYSWQPTVHTAFKVAPVFLTLVSTSNISDSTEKILASNPTLAQQLFPYTILGSSINYDYNNKSNQQFKNYSVFRINAEKAGALLNLVVTNPKDNKNIARYFKVETEYKHYTLRRKSTWVNRAYTYIGVPYGSNTLPFIKQQNIGGPFSLRGWRVFELGPGANLDTSSSIAKLFSNNGDIKLELNSEFRKPLFKIFSGAMQVEGAAFVDAGNIWRYKDTTNPSAQFALNRLYKDLAVNTGAGLRLDLSLFLVRLDWGLPIKQPYLLGNQWGFTNPNQSYAFNPLKWFGQQSWWGTNSTFQVGINYPF